MGDTQNTVVDDLAPSAPVDNGPLTASEADERLEALLGGNLPSEDPADETVGNSDAVTQEPVDPENPDEDIDPALLEDPADPTDPDENPDTSYTDGQFVPDGGKVKLADGRTISVGELKEFTERRVKEMQGDYTKKNMELSERTKAHEAKEAEYSQERDAFQNERAWAQFVLQTYAPQQPQVPKVSGSQDPMAWIQYQSDLAKYEEAVNAWHALNQGQQAEKEKANRETQAQAQQRIQAEVAELHKIYPILKDPAKSKEWFDDTRKAAAEFFGISGEEFDAIGDHRMMRVLRSGIQAERARRKTTEVKKEVQRKPPVAQGSGPRNNPEASQRRELDGLRKNLRETGSPAAAEALLAKILG